MRFTQRPPSDWWFTWSELNKKAAIGKNTQKNIASSAAWPGGGGGEWSNAICREGGSTYGECGGNQGAESHENGSPFTQRSTEIIQTQRKPWQLRPMINKAICSHVTSKTPAESMLFLISSSNVLNHWPKGRAFAILSNSALKCPVWNLFYFSSIVFSDCVYMPTQLLWPFWGHDQSVQLNQSK